MTTWNWRLRFALAVCVTAVAGSLFAVSFRSLLAFLYSSAYRATNVVDAIAGLKWWLRLIVPVIAATAAGSLARLRGSQGVSNVMEAVALGNVQLSLRTTLWRVASSWVAIAGGMSIGREGPLIEFGGTVGAALSRRMGLSLTQTRILVAAGTASGFASAYNTPFAAILFVFETMIGIAAPEALLPTITATVIATTLTRTVVGAGPIYGERLFGSQSPGDLVFFAGLGLVTAFAGVAFKRLLEIAENLFEQHAIPQPLRASVGGLAVGAIAVVVPEVAGNGYEPLNVILDQRMLLATIGLLIVAKVIATSASVASGVPGGIFTPTLLIGAGVGALFSAMIGAITGAAPDAGSCALVGMAAATAATIHAPITSAVLVFELSGDYAIALPLLLATVLSTATSRALGSSSVYERELQRKGVNWRLTLEGRRIEERELETQPAAGDHTPSSGSR